MSQFIIEGGHRLNGTITAGGNKNAALKLIPACLLTDQPVVLHNVPSIEDVHILLDIMQDLGVEVAALGESSWRIQAKQIAKTDIDPALASRIRASFVLSGPMLARMGRITLPFPGGDMIGGRPLDTHVRGLEALGATAVLDNGIFDIQASKLHGAGYLLQPEASVTATENTLMAAVLAEGETILDNAASEPHVQDLCHLLNQMGAKIEGIGSSRLYIQGVNALGGAEYKIGSDYMEVGSFIGAAAVTGGQVRIKNASPQRLGMIRLVYEKLGVIWEVDGEDIVVPAGQDIAIQQTLAGRILEIKPMPWPGFPPDLMSIAVVMATQAHGSVLLHDWMYESRFFFTDKLVFMGARIVMCDPHRIIVQGRSPLYANPNGVTSPDIRAGMAMVLAALCAQGTSVIHNIHQIDRGYERVEQKLAALGACIERVEEAY
ncbi:MAG: UDP-N-acetylglucosamine 1-carboxyvinyltransferase [Anaerolineales bacterium]|nr:UDP-N-acetylglucosamine 1-carboxyvinyltransferase [Anaerolineales bacterium]